jgi:hypothetical protein
MKTWLSIVMFLLVLFAVCTARAQDSQSLGDVARKSRSEKKEESKIVVSDQEHDQSAVPVSNDSSLCGAPLPIMQSVYVAALTGQKTPPEDEMAKELMGWLNVHPDLQKMDPEKLAKTDEPRTDAQEQSDRDLANQISQSFTDDMIEYKKNHTDEEVQDKLGKLMSAKLPARQADVLESAVRDEKRRRETETSPQNDKDRLEQAVNLYAICENKRLIVSQGEVEKMSKAALKSKLEEAGFTLEQPSTDEAKGN